ncbi:hypothetical protein [Uliginosibacterium sediminicola]|uniref:Integrase catalytic domain-containing protein n=1 Tax=Uliginosibacterium sediminicola TaxID=2024550 RepID=A0ABU9YT73_9RHOO
MAKFFLEKGLVILWRSELLEYRSRHAAELYFENPETGRQETLIEADFWQAYSTGALTIVRAFSSPKKLICEELKTTPTVRLADVSENNQEEALRRLEYINKLVEAGVSVGQKEKIDKILPEISRELGDGQNCPSVSTVCRWWRKYISSGGEVVALISKNTYRASLQRFDEESERFVQDAIDAHYLVDTRPSARSAYEMYVAKLAQENRNRARQQLPRLQKVSERTFYVRIDSLDKYEVDVARYGREETNRKYRMIKGHLPAVRPLDAVEIDHTPLNLYSVDDLVHLPLGRPWLTAIKDRYTKILLGFYVSFQQTGLASIFGAIKHSLHSHQMAYERWPDLVNPWPAYGLGALYVSDRGLDFQSLRYRAAIASLGSLYELCKRRTPWLKSSIERFFLTLEQTFFEAMPGKTFAALHKREGYDPVKQSVIRFSTLIYLLHKWAVDYHNIQTHSRSQASPLELWNEGIQNAPPPYPANVDELNIILGSRHEGMLSHEGVRFMGLYYSDEALHDLMKKAGRNTSVEYAVSLEDLGHIHVKNPRSGEYMKVRCTRPEYASGLSLYQHKYLRQQAKSAAGASPSIDVLLQTRLDIAATIAAEVDRKENLVKARLARTAGINSNALLQGKIQSVTTPFEGQSLIVPTALEVPVTNTPRYSWGV